MKSICIYKQFHNSMTPEWLLKRKDVSIGAKMIYGRLARYAGKDSYCYPKKKTLADEVGLSVRQLHRYINELVDLKLIHVERKGLNRPNKYTFLEHEWMQGYFISDKTDMAHQDKTDVSGQDVTDMAHHDVTDVADPYIRESKEKNHLRDTIHRFEEFWDLYDKKLERRKCENKWKKLSSDDKESIMQFIPIYKQSVSSKQYLKHPFTFLNSRIWEDDWNNYKADERPNTANSTANGRMENAYRQFNEIFGNHQTE